MATIVPVKQNPSVVSVYSFRTVHLFKIRAAIFSDLKNVGVML